MTMGSRCTDELSSSRYIDEACTVQNVSTAAVSDPNATAGRIQRWLHNMGG
jgi:hypothetical protein